MAAIGKSGAMVACTVLQPTLNIARLAAKTWTQGTISTEMASEKGRIRLECPAAVHLIRNKGWETRIDECVHRGWMEGEHVEGQP